MPSALLSSLLFLFGAIMREIKNTNPWELWKQQSCFLILPCGSKVGNETGEIALRRDYREELKKLEVLPSLKVIGEIFSHLGPRSWILPDFRLGFLPIRRFITEGVDLELLSESVFLMRERILFMNIYQPIYLLGWGGESWPHSKSIISGPLGEFVTILWEGKKITPLAKWREKRDKVHPKEVSHAD
jgi:hypothetical protein